MNAWKSLLWKSLFMGITWSLVLSVEGAVASQRGAIAGRVMTPVGDPVVQAETRLVNLRRRVLTGDDGRFRFDGVPPGSHLLEVSSPLFGSAVRRLTVEAGEVTEVEIVLDLAIHREEIVVSASTEARGLMEVAQPVNVLSGDELSARMEMTLGETLAKEPGVASTYFGPGASRPVIRGLGGDRIRVLEGGLGTGDASNTSPDHAVSMNPLAAQRIEILRGPATLLYGSNAVGGVVNVIDGRIPDYIPGRNLTGVVEVRGGTVAEERSGAVVLEGGRRRIAWHLDYLRRETKDVEIPGRAVAGEGEEAAESPRGILKNSAVEAEGGTVGLSYIGENGFLGIAFTGYDSLYGVPGVGEEEEDEGEENGAAVFAASSAEGEEVKIDLEQRRVDLRGEINRPLGAFRGIKLRVGVADYEHVELEGDEIGTRFTNDFWEARLEAPHREAGPFTSGALGFQYSQRDFAAIGEEAFVPPTDTENWALFIVEELGRDPWKYSFGLRYEEQDIRAATGDRRSLDGLSASVGVVWAPQEDYSVAVSLARAVKLPTAEELFSDGPHLATNAFEVGDPGLREEVSHGLDVTLRKRTGRVTGEINLFVNRFDDFIFQEFTGDVEDGLQVLQYSQGDAEFLGGEIHADIELLHIEPHHLDLELTADYVRAELRDTGEPLPRIPPLRLTGGLRYQGSNYWARVEVQRVEDQDRLGLFETPTDGYTLVNADLGFRFFLADRIHDVVLRGTNLTDREARNHVSFLKDVAPLPGRDFSLSYRLTF